MTVSNALNSMSFSDEELELAQLFKAYGLDWTPTCGQYVLDQSQLIECDSPFQGRVFYILDLKHFLRRSGTVERLREAMCWLPTWEQARCILRDFHVSDARVAVHLAETSAIETGTERLELYRLIEAEITSGQTA